MTKREKEDAFITDFIALCKKYGLALESDDPYCGLNVVGYGKKMRKYYNEPDSFGRWRREEKENV